MPTYIRHSREETVALGKRAAAVQPAYIRAFESALLQVCRSLTL